MCYLMPPNTPRLSSFSCFLLTTLSTSPYNLLIPFFFYFPCSADADFSCFADLALTSPVDYYREGQGSLMQCVLTPADKYLPQPNEEIVAEVDKQVGLLKSGVVGGKWWLESGGQLYSGVAGGCTHSGGWL